ncbi:MAG: FAD-dependent cmnm(5)s(2)U34 oxidoreductase, partial [Burkholderiaceae bacterium]
MSEPVVWAGDGSPHSPRFNDRYRSRSGAVAQATTVFLAGCGLPGRWRGAAEFTVLEAGFGLGINFLTTWAAWEVDEQRCERLHFVSIEAYPVATADIVRGALAPDEAAATPDSPAPLPGRVKVLAQQLAGAWGVPSPGLHHLHFADGAVQLTLAVGEVQPMLERLACVADAVYLDGFSPARNPDMWSPATLQALARHCGPGTTLATYTVAHSVREVLQ